MLVALIKFPFIVQVLVFLMASGVLVYYTRPIAKQYLKIGATKTNVNSVISQTGIVTKKILPYNTGQVKVSGQIWTAKSHNNEQIDEETTIEVVRVEGVKLIVKKLD